MLGRTANDLFWMSRYIERAENIARLLEVGYRIALLPREGDGQDEEWRSTLRSAGCEKGYLAKYGAYDTRDVVNYMLFDPDNPSSVYSSLATARRNARAQRTALTREMWESLNSAWLEFASDRPHQAGLQRAAAGCSTGSRSARRCSAARCSTPSCATTPSTSASSAPSWSAPTTPPASST